MRILHILSLLLLAVMATAQQEAVFSQFFYQKNLSNPGATASSGTASLAAFHRHQWSGLDGAPVTSALLFSAPAFGDRVGLGLNLVNDRIGFFNITYINAAYAYRIKFDKGVLGIGMHGSYRQQKTDWSAARTISSGVDPRVGADDLVPLFNVGIGFHFENEQFFAGAAIPQVVEKGFVERNEGLVSDFSGTVRHLFLHAGYLVELSRQVKLRPAMAARVVKNAPPGMDLHLSLGLLDDSRLWMGGTYRWGQSVYASAGDVLAIMCQYRISERLQAGLACDLTVGSIRRYHAGTYELMLEYSFLKDGTGVRNPRYF